MKLYGGSGGRKKKKSPKQYHDNRMDDETRVIRRYGDEEEEDQPQRTPEELERIDKLIEKYQRYKRRKRLFITLILLIIIAVAAIFLRSYIKAPAVSTPPPAQTLNVGLNTSSTPAATSNTSTFTRKDGVFTFLLLGKDVEAGLTDTILIGRLDTINNSLNIVSIPRDTLINVSRNYKKINGMYSHNGNDIEKAKTELKSILGFTVDCYAIIDIKAFQKIVDTIGGVDFNVPINMDYDDDVQDFHVHLMSGMQHLNGASALGVVRFRQNNEGSPYGPGYPRADIDRIETQQSFMKAVAKQCLTIGNATKVNDFAQIFKDYIDTNLSNGNMVWFGLQFLNIKNNDNIKFDKMPGEYDDYALDMACVTIKLDDWLTMINDKLSPYKEKITSDNLNVITRDKDGKLYSTSGKILK